MAAFTASPVAASKTFPKFTTNVTELEILESTSLLIQELSNLLLDPLSEEWSATRYSFCGLIRPNQV